MIFVEPRNHSKLYVPRPSGSFSEALTISFSPTFGVPLRATAPDTKLFTGLTFTVKGIEYLPPLPSFASILMIVPG